jgi:Helix-turn-helix family
LDYEAVAKRFLIPTGAPMAEQALPSSPARRLRDAIEPIATIGWWSRAAATGLDGLGHDFFDGYVWGRAASLGADVTDAVVVAAFGVFDAGLLTAVYRRGRAVSTPDAVRAARAPGASEGLAAAAGGIDPAVLDDFGSLLLHALADLDGVGRPLFGALRQLPVPTDPFGRAWRAAELVREHRGDGHIAACVASGLEMVTMNVLTELWLGYPAGEYSATRGFSPERIGVSVARLRERGWLGDDGLTAAGRAARDGIEDATDRSQDALIEALGDSLDTVLDAGTAIGSAVIAAHAAPADPRKRAAG